MYQQTDLFYKFRFLIAGILTAGFLILISALVTAVGSNTVLDVRTHPAVTATSTVPTDGPNLITSGASTLANGLQRAGLSIGTGLYEGCRTITAASATAGKSTARGAVTVGNGMWGGTKFMVRGLGSINIFAYRVTGDILTTSFRLPGKIARPLTATHTVSAIIRPAEDKPVPVISSETSAAALATLNAQEQQEVAKWQAAQLAANRGLGGVILAGDPNHGGYPTKWDTIAQDSTLDSWGMYNRECVSYAAWKVYQTYGYMPFWGGVGNANQWPSDARRAGITTSSVPKVHSVAISMYGYYGHAMWVEAVSGNMVYVSQYNYDLHGHYSEMWVDGSHFTYIYFK